MVVFESRIAVEFEFRQLSPRKVVAEGVDELGLQGLGQLLGRKLLRAAGGVELAPVALTGRLHGVVEHYIGRSQFRD